MSTAAIADPVRANEHRRLAWERILAWVVMEAIMLTTLFPLYWILHTALSSNSPLCGGVTSWLPTDWNAGSFARVFGIQAGKEALAGGGSDQLVDFWRYLGNSIVVATLITVGQVLSFACAAYTFSRLGWKGKDLVYGLFLGGLVVPAIFAFLPNFVLIEQLGLIDALFGISLPAMLMTLFIVFFLGQFFTNVPIELEEAVLFDGSSRIGSFFRLILPVSAAPIVTISLLTFINSWSDYFWPLMVSYPENSRVLAIGLGVFRSQAPSTDPGWAGLMAAALVTAVPMLVLFAPSAKRIVNSIGFSGTK